MLPGALDYLGGVRLVKKSKAGRFSVTRDMLVLKPFAWCFCMVVTKSGHGISQISDEALKLRRFAQSGIYRLERRGWNLNRMRRLYTYHAPKFLQLTRTGRKQLIIEEQIERLAARLIRPCGARATRTRSSMSKSQSHPFPDFFTPGDIPIRSVSLRKLRPVIAVSY